jgi:hypothetical protein
MDPSVAQRIARGSHGAQRDRFGELVIDHVERVAAAVPADARTTALLHDVLERTNVSVDDLRRGGLTSTELAAVLLLTRAPDESFELQVLTIEHTPGPAGRLARCVKLADLDDHLARELAPADAPAYAWARRHIARGRERDDDAEGSPAAPHLRRSYSGRSARGKRVGPRRPSLRDAQPGT